MGNERNHGVRRKAIFLYLGPFLSTIIIGNLIATYVGSTLNPASKSPLLKKTEYYIWNAAQFDLIFVGDSRTYCNIHPDLLDPLLGSRSLNLSGMAHWFPTQYQQFRDIISHIPAGTLVVWSVGHQNFAPGNRYWWQPNYPVSAGTLAQYIWWGYPVRPCLRSFLGDESFSRGGRYILNRFRVFLQQPIKPSVIFDIEQAGNMGSSNVSEVSIIGQYRNIETKDLDMIVRNYRSNPRVSQVDQIKDGDLVTSLVVHWNGGSYFRVELIPQYFRDRQRESHDRIVEEVKNKCSAGDYQTHSWHCKEFTPYPAYWNTFEAILKLFSEHKIRLIVNEVEEAPNNYFDENERSRMRSFMRQKVKLAAERYGFAYMYLDMDHFDDSDYFDYNHFNSRGIEKYTPLFAERLRPSVAFLK